MYWLQSGMRRAVHVHPTFSACPSDRDPIGSCDPFVATKRPETSSDRDSRLPTTWERWWPPGPSIAEPPEKLAKGAGGRLEPPLAHAMLRGQDRSVLTIRPRQIKNVGIAAVRGDDNQMGRPV